MNTGYVQRAQSFRTIAPFVRFGYGLEEKRQKTARRNKTIIKAIHYNDKMNNSTEITLNSVSFRLNEMHDFSWLTESGEVFCVFDQQNSGNLCFGINRNGKNLFVKYAGAKTTEYKGEISDAIDRLSHAIPLYQSLKHDHLIPLIDSFKTPNGYAAVFVWFSGETLHQHWIYPAPEKYTNPNSSFYKFRNLPLAHRLRALEIIYSFHVHVANMGFVAIDFYDGNILYNFTNNTMKICDIDCYRQSPFVNTMGRLWGASRFMSPEEFTKGAIIDEKTNVYNMGATAFCLIGGIKDRTIEKWEGSEELYHIAKKATSDERNDRFSSLNEFYAEWSKAAENAIQ